MLVASGYDVLNAANAREAIHLLKEALNAIDLVLSNVQLPGMTGVALLETVRAMRWSVSFVLLAQRPDLSMRALVDSYDVALLEKPFEVDELRRIVHDELLRIRPEPFTSREQSRRPSLS